MTAACPHKEGLWLKPCMHWSITAPTTCGWRSAPCRSCGIRVTPSSKWNFPASAPVTCISATARCPVPCPARCWGTNSWAKWWQRAARCARCAPASGWPPMWRPFAAPAGSAAGATSTTAATAAGSWAAASTAARPNTCACPLRTTASTPSLMPCPIRTCCWWATCWPAVISARNWPPSAPATAWPCWGPGLWACAPCSARACSAPRRSSPWTSCPAVCTWRRSAVMPT